MTIENRKHITPASGQRAEILDRMLGLAKELPQIIELERSGVRDGNGYWQGSDALHTAVDLGKAYRELREVETAVQHDEICSGCGAHMQATHHPRCKGAVDTTAQHLKNQGCTTGTLVWVGHDGAVISIPRVLEDSLQYAQLNALTLGESSDEIPF